MLYQFLPRLSDDEYSALEKSIREHGVQVPIVVDENKSIIDGHHRKEIADRLGLECPRRFSMDLDDTQKRTLALSLNLDRRHLTREQKRALVEASVKADPQLSDRQHAGRTGVSDKTVAAVRAPLEARAEIPHADTRTDSLGRSQPAERSAVRDEPAAVPGASSRTPPRRALPNQFFDAAVDFGKAVERLERLAADDRFTQNAGKVAARHRNDLLRYRDLLQEVIDRLPQPDPEDTQ